MNEDLIMLEKLQEICDDMDNMICTTQKPFIRLKLMEIISEIDIKITDDEKGIWSDFATEGLLIDESKPGVIKKVSV